ncbi:hypothetical protein ABIC65_001119 [Sphingomonas trueperi]
MMRVLSNVLFALAGLTGVCAMLVYGYLVELACGYAPGAMSCSGAPWDLTADDRFWLIGMPSIAIASLLALGALARRKA